MSESTNGVRRGRPPHGNEDREAARARIAATAVRLFRDEGYGAVSLRGLARAAGCAPNTLYAYFESKADILRHLWAEVFAELFDQLEATAGGIADPRQRLLTLSRDYARYWVDNPESYRMVFMTEGVTQPEVDVFLSAPGAAERFELFSDTLREALADQPKADLEQTGQALLCALQGVAHSLVTMSGHPWRTPETLVTILVAGLIPEAPGRA